MGLRSAPKAVLQLAVDVSAVVAARMLRECSANAPRMLRGNVKHY